MAVPTGISPGINPAISSPVSWNLPDFNFDPLWNALESAGFKSRVSTGDYGENPIIGDVSVPFGPSGNIDHDLVEHYYNSQRFAEDVGRVPSALGGLSHEVFNAFDPSSTGFSPDDL